MNGRRFAAKRGRILARPRSDRWARRAIAHLARDCEAEAVFVRGRLVAHHFPDGFVVCELRRYSTPDAAVEELRNVWAFAHLHDHRLPVRPFYCNRCRGFHVTSRA